MIFISPSFVVRIEKEELSFSLEWIVLEGSMFI